MFGNSHIAIIVEGESYETKVVKGIQNVFFNNRLGKMNYKILCLPAARNIYMLWNDIKEDGYIDIIELVRESSDVNRKILSGFHRDSFAEIYLFFDYDKHQDNLKTGVLGNDVLKEMLSTFDNETENGKLYISYPMAEAIRDFVPESCRTFTKSCYISRDEKQYKHLTGTDNPMVHVKRYTSNRWATILDIFLCRLSCLLRENKRINITDCKQLTPFDVYSLQMDHENIYDKYIILSAFPEFLMDYFPADYLEELIRDNGVDYPGIQKCGYGDKTVQLFN